ncbi:MAG: transporter, ATP-binding/permease protein [Anaerocolumna sp.]|nr:transporter, ATP-binding/permease protein [Anaerocolumna sp.]
MSEQRQKGTMGKVFKYLKRYKQFIILSIILAGIAVYSTLYFLKLIGDAIDCIIGPDNVDFTGLRQLLMFMIILIGVTGISQWIMNICNNKIVYGVIKDLRRDAFEKIEILPLKYIDSKSHGETVSKIITDVDQFADGLLMALTQFFPGIMTIIGTLFFMFKENVNITLVVICLTPISIFIAGYISKKTYRLFKQQSEIRGEQTGYVEEMLGNQKVVQAYGHEIQSQKDFKVVNEKLQSVSLHAIFYSSITNPATRFVNGLVYTGVGITGALAVVNGGLTLGVLTVFLNYANQYTKPFNEISGVVTEFQNALACARRVLELIEEEPQVPESTDAVVLENVKGKVQLSNVEFSYQKDRKLIEQLNLVVNPGQRIAIVGPTGCGKTTIINLLMRFYEVDSGSISVDGFDIRDITRKSLRTNYGMVLQETWLKTGTIRENLTIGKPEATEEEVITAAKAAHVHNVIKRMPDGYNTMINDEGNGLSQGEKQLLCIARVMICLPPMLILDEATSSIDTRTELKIQQAFALMMKGRTSFVIAHRLSTIKDADIILVMKDGHIIEQGNHEELIKTKGFYYNLYSSQFVKEA